MQPTKTHVQIHNQPADLRTLLQTGWEQADQATALIHDARRVILTGIGTSHHAASVGAGFLRAAGLDALAVHAFDLASYPESHPVQAGDAVIVFGHTGNTRFTRHALDLAVAAGVPVIAVGSTTAEHPGASLVLRTVAPETSTTYTTSHLSAMASIAMVAHRVAMRAGASLATSFRSHVEQLPDIVAAILARAPEIDPIAELAVGRRVYAIGAGPNQWTAHEVMIKVREAAYHPIDGMAAEQFLHGPMVGVNAGDLAIVIHVPGPSASRVAEIARALAAIGVHLWVVGSPVNGLDAPCFALPELPEVLTPLTALIPMQLFSVALAALNGANPDEFRCDEPVHRAAFSLLNF